MKAIPLTVVALIVGAALFTPVAAYADDFPADHSDFDQVEGPEIDCDTGAWTVTIVHWSWWENPDGSGGRWGTTGEITAPAPEGSGGGVPAECPWWELGDDSVWYDSRTDPAAVPHDGDEEAWLDSGWTGEQQPSTDETDAVDPTDSEKVGLAVVWKAGI